MYGRMEESMWDNINKIRKKDTVSSFGQMVDIIRVVGNRVSNMVSGCIRDLRCQKKGKEDGLKARE